jgi:glutathione S-transferase
MPSVRVNRGAVGAGVIVCGDCQRRSSLRLYHVPGTRSTRVLWALEEAGAPFELVVLEREGRQTPEHLARHPLGRVPVAETEDGFVFESGALCLHIADLYPEARLTGPPRSHERALVYQWVAFALTELDSNLVGVMRHRESDPVQADAAAERVRDAARAIDVALSGREFLVAERFTVADVMCGEQLGLASRFDLTDDLPNVGAYLERLAERPALQRAQAVGID